jgi:hypothetical protein
MHEKFLKLGMIAPYVIPHLLTKWQIQIYLVYMLCHFLALTYLNFNQLFLHDLWLNFGYVTPYIISNVHQNLHKFWPSESYQIIFNLL